MEFLSIFYICRWTWTYCFDCHSIITFKGKLLGFYKEDHPTTDSECAAAVERAKRSVGKLKGKYHVSKNNCEHLVSYWLTTEGYSIQSGEKVK